MKYPWPLFAVPLAFLTVVLAPLQAQVGVHQDIVGVDAVAQTSPPQITLSWQPHINPSITTGHRIFRRSDSQNRNAIFSTDGLNWSDAVTPPPLGLASVAYGTPSGVPTFVGISNNAGVYKSTDGSNWTRTALTADNLGGRPNIITYGNGLFMTALNGYFYRSSDGTTWTKSAFYGSDQISNYVINDIQYDNGVWVAVGIGANAGDIPNAEGEDISPRLAILTSTNGSSWTVRKDDETVPGNENIGRILHGVAYGNGAWISVGLGGNIYRSTNNGVTWNYSQIPGSITGTSTHLYSVAYANNCFVAVGTSANQTNGTPVVLRSTDAGLTWSPVDLGSNPATRQTLNRIRVNGGQFHAVGDGGAYVTSTDGLTWTARSTANTSPQKDIAFGSSLQVIASQPGWGKTPLISNLSSTTLSFTDTDVQPGIVYKYAVARRNVATQYLNELIDLTQVAIELPMVEQRGTVVLVVENTLPTTLAADYQRFRNDLVGDGWKIAEILVPRALTNPTGPQRLAEVQFIRTAIQAIYQADPANVNSVLLIGAIPVPLSGYNAPDGHEPRPMPADTYYADMTGTWTDTQNSAGRIPGDGKFDQGVLPVLPQLAVGRIDFNDMPSFGIPEIQLIQRYFQKNHKFRHGLISANRKSYAANAWSRGPTRSINDYVAIPMMRGFASSLGYSNLTYSQFEGWREALTANSYLISYGSGGGSRNAANGIVTTADFAANRYQTFFITLYGSYFVEYQSFDALLRAAIAMADYGLTSDWGTQYPSDYGLNVPIGLSYVKSYHEAADAPMVRAEASTYSGKLGDITLHILPTKPVSGLNLVVSAGQNTLSWTASTDSNIVGYQVYRSTNLAGPYTRLTGAAATASNPSGSALVGTSFTDTTAVPGTIYQYMVRAVKREVTNQGTHYNLSQGVFVTNEIPAIAADQAINAPASNAFSYAINASNAPTSYTLTSGSLPPGLTLNSATGIISGTPTTVGSYSASFTATNGGGTSPAVSIPFTIIPSALIIHEPFGYTLGANNPDPDGGLNNNNGLPATNTGGNPSGAGTGLRGSWSTSTDVVAGLTYRQANKVLDTSGNAARVNLAGWGGNPYIYNNMASDPFLGQRIGGSNNGNLGPDGSSLYVSLLASTSSATDSAFRFSFKYDGSQNLYVSNTPTGWRIDNATAAGVPLELNKTTLLVVRFDFAAGATDTVNLWVNPPLGQPLGAPHAAVSGKNFPGLGNMQNVSTVANAMTIDEVRVGTSFSAVTPFVELPVPPSPSNLVATGTAADEIRLTWVDNSNNETGFKIERSPNGSSAWTDIATVAANATTFTDTDRLPTTNYYYRVSAINANGASPATTIVTGTTLAIPSDLLMVKESFAYTIGANNPQSDAGLNGGNGLPGNNFTGSPAGSGTGLRGNWGTSLDVVAGLTYEQGNKTLRSSGGAGRVNNATWGGNPYIYRNMNYDPYIGLRIGNSTNGNFGPDGSSIYLSLIASTSSSTASAFRFSLRYDGTANFYVQNTSTGWSLNATNATGAPLALNTPTLLVLRMDFAAGSNDTVSLWVNPPLGQALGAPNATVSGLNFPGLNNFQTNSAVANAMTFDELRVGNSLAAVTPFTGVAPPAPLADFRTTYGLPADGSQDLLSPAGEGVANLLKYAFNMLGSGLGQAEDIDIPNASVLTASGTAGLPLVGVESGTGKLQLTYIRRKTASYPGINYTVEFSGALASWAVNGSATERVTGIDATFERVTVTDSVAAPAKRFARVRITPN